MLKNTLKVTQHSSDPASLNGTLASTALHKGVLPGFAFCTAFFVLCILLTVSPLIRMPDPHIMLHIEVGSWLAQASNWLPTNLGSTYQPSTGSIEFFALMLLLICCYIMGMLLLRRQPTHSKQGLLRGLIWLGVILGGAIWLVTPALLSHDILVYASYSRLLAVYHANPYFVLMSSFPRDPITRVDDYATSLSAYGPIWMLTCAIWGWLPANPANYVIGFRLFALSMDLLNIWLIGRTLRKMGSSPRTITLGMLLYAWNPLVLLECAQNGHNDVFMMTFVLAGIFLAVRAEKRRELLHPRGYLPAAGMLSLAALVKFTALPVLAVFLVFLACMALPASSANIKTFKQALRHWHQALPVLLWTSLTALLIGILFYGLFWLGHGSKQIIAGFQSPPSSTWAENSFLRAIINWLHFHQSHLYNPFFEILDNRHTWDMLNVLAILGCLLIGATYIWRQQNSNAFIMVALATMCVILLITPWFFPWYLTWIVSLAAVCAGVSYGYRKTAWIGLALSYSFSALTLYLFNSGLLGTRGYLSILFTAIPAGCAFLLILLYQTGRWQTAKVKVN